LALLIGNNNYSDTRLSKLRKTDADVDALDVLLRDPAIGFFDKVMVHKDVTCEAARRLIGTLCATARKDDFLLFFFAGHGIPSPDRQNLYLAMSDTDLDLPPSATAIEARHITEILDASHASRQLIVLDCCFAGLAQRGSRATLGTGVNAVAAFRGKDRGRVLLTATDSTEAAFEGDDVVTGDSVNSVFTRFLIKGLATGEADRGCDGIIDPNELYKYLYENVTANSNQTPGISIREGYGELVVAKSKKNSISPELAHDFRGRLGYRRKAAAEELERLVNGTDPSLASAAKAFLEVAGAEDDPETAATARRILASYATRTRESAQVRTTALRDARLKIARGDFAGALQLLDERIQADPDDKELTQLRERARKLQAVTSEASSLARAGKVLAALATVDVALNWFPDDPVLRELRKSIRTQADRLASEISSLARRAAKLAAQGRLEQAFTLVGGTLKQHPGNPELVALLADLNRTIDRNTAIEQICRRAISLERQHDFAGAREAIGAGLDRFPREKRLIDLQRSIEGGRKAYRFGRFCKTILTRLRRHLALPPLLHPATGQTGAPRPRKLVNRAVLGALSLIFALALAALGFSYSHYAGVVDEQLRPILHGAASAVPRSATPTILYAAPSSLAIADSASPRDVASFLQNVGYTENSDNPLGYYALHPDAIEIFPGPESYFDREGIAAKFVSGKVARIVSLRDNSDLPSFLLEPQPIGSISPTNAAPNRPASFAEIPVTLRNAILAAHDSGFFQTRILPSRLTVQLARKLLAAQTGNAWLDPAAAFLMGIRLERELTKQKIFELYCNQMDFGRFGGVPVHGVVEAADDFFGKSLPALSLPEAAALAAQLLDPTRDLRNVVLARMREFHLISDRDYSLAVAVPPALANANAGFADASYFVDLVKSELDRLLPDRDLRTQSDRIYTTLDLDLQRAAIEAVRAGMEHVDEQLRTQKRFRGQAVPAPQVALVAVDPHTGEIKALVGGRNYALSQANYSLARRQSGSIFKPIVYAAALNTGVEGGSKVLTASTTVVDEPTTFWFDNKSYLPDNFNHKYFETVTLRDALTYSMNVATVKVAEMVGYAAVVDLANRAGMNDETRPTPAVAMGDYEITPLQAAGAYTVFGNNGAYVEPSLLGMIRSREGQLIFKNRVQQKQVLDPRVAYIMTNLLEGVMRNGTAADARALLLAGPAAGETGPSHDGWFAGFTSNLLCVVWVGFDDNRQLDLDGSHSAGIIWAGFMNRALQYHDYRHPKPFESPDGIVQIRIDPASGMRATPLCPKTRDELYIAGTEPVGACFLHGSGRRNVDAVVSGWDTPPTPSTRQVRNKRIAGKDTSK
jgi:penicillin-binding protein 1B